MENDLPVKTARHFTEWEIRGSFTPLVQFNHTCDSSLLQCQEVMSHFEHPGASDTLTSASPCAWQINKSIFPPLPLVSDPLWTKATKSLSGSSENGDYQQNLLYPYYTTPSLHSHLQIGVWNIISFTFKDYTACYKAGTAYFSRREGRRRQPVIPQNQTLCYLTLWKEKLD